MVLPHATVDDRVLGPPRDPDRRTPIAPFALAAVGVGATAALALGGAAPPAGFTGLPALIADAYRTVHEGTGRTTIITGGASDPDAAQQVARIGTRGTDGDQLRYVNQPGSVGLGGEDGIPPILFGGTDTYDGTVAKGSANTVAAITQGTNQQVVIYTISQGADLTDVALLEYERNPTPGATVHVVQYGAPGFPETGWWNIIPAGIPGLPGYGPVDTTHLQHSTVTDVCVRGDTACGAGNPLATPVATAFYAVPGFLIHGQYYTYDNLSPYSTPDTPGVVTGASTDGDAVDGGVLVPGAADQRPHTERVETRADGALVTVRTYDDGTVTRTWQDGSTTYVVIDNGQNPWGWLLRDLGVPVPRAADQVLNAVVPVPMPGEPNRVGPVEVPTVFEIQRALLPFSVAPQPDSPAPAAPAPQATAPPPLASATPAARLAAVEDDGAASPTAGGGRHAIGIPGLVPFRGGAPSADPIGSADSVGSAGSAAGTTPGTAPSDPGTGDDAPRPGGVAALLDRPANGLDGAGTVAGEGATAPAA